MDADQAFREHVRGELKLDGGEVALGSRTVVHQPDVAAGDVEALLHNLGLCEDAGNPQRFSVVVGLPSCQSDRDHRVKVVLHTSVDLTIKFWDLLGNCEVGENRNKFYLSNILEDGNKIFEKT